MPGLQSLCVKNVLVVVHVHVQFMFMYKVENNTVHYSVLCTPYSILHTPYSVDYTNNNLKFNIIKFDLIPPILLVRPFLVPLVSYL
jgi:hypothetical protein